MKIHLLTIDPQVDFTMPANPVLAGRMLAANGGAMTPEIELVQNGGALYVTGAENDMIRLSNMVDRLRKKIDAIHVTLDSHNDIHIAHPIFWVDSKGNHPNPFTLITEDDVVKGVWTTTNPAARQRALEYVRTLKANKRYVLCIWPPHCIIGTYGHSIYPCLSKSLTAWCKERFKKIDIVTKGSNVMTEHYSAVKADVVDNGDPTTMMNTGLVTTLATADVILIAGEALSHCVASTITDVADELGDENVKKFILLEDCCSNVGGFEKMGSDFIDRMTKRGMKIAKSTDYLA
jgi:nicotinamidase-related amidase